jgi:hypothetical protein
MLDGRGGLCLALKARDGLAFLKIVAVENVRPDRLDRNFSGVKLLVLGQVYLPHSTATQAPFQQITVGDHLRTRQR